MGCGGWEGNFLITASSKDKTFCVYNMIYYTAFKNKNLLSKSSKTSKPSKPPVKIINNMIYYCRVNRSKTSCQKHQTYCHDNMIYYTGSPALYRKSRLHRKSRLIQEVPPPIPEVPPTPEVPPLYQKSRLHLKSRPYTGSPAHLAINHFDRWCMVLTTHVDIKMYGSSV